MSIADQGAALAPISAAASLEPETPVSRLQRLAGLLIVVTIALLPLIVASVFAAIGIDVKPSDSSIRYRYLNLLLMELTSLALLAYVVRQNHQNLADFGLVFRWRDIAYGMLLWAIALCGYRLAYPSILSACELLGWHRAAPYLPRLKLGLGLLTYFFVVVNPVFEEMIVRAFLMTETVALTGSSILAVIVSVSLQTSYHLYQGLPYALSAGVIFLIFSVYYARTRRIGAIIVAHFIWDLSAHLSYAFQGRTVHS